MNNIKCVVCGNIFESKRLDSKYCSGACKLKHFRNVTDNSVTDKCVTDNVTDKMFTTPNGRVRKVCVICPVCKYPNWNGELMYPEDDKGVPYCNSEGILSDRNREILSMKPNELTSEKAPQTGPYR